MAADLGRVSGRAWNRGFLGWSPKEKRKHDCSVCGFVRAEGNIDIPSLDPL